MDISLKKILLAGIGAMAYSYEKGTEIIEDLIEKGELTVAQGKELNEELKRKRKEDKEDAEALEERIKNLEDK